MKAVYALVGMKHRGTEDFVRALDTGEPAELVREPGNRFDVNAVQVWMRERHVGYVKGTQAAQLARVMDTKGLPKLTGTLVAERWPMIEVLE